MLCRVGGVGESTATGLSQAERQAALVGDSVTLQNHLTENTIYGFQANSVTWVSVTRGENQAEFGRIAARELSRLGIAMMEIY